MDFGRIRNVCDCIRIQLLHYFDYCSYISKSRALAPIMLHENWIFRNSISQHFSTTIRIRKQDHQLIAPFPKRRAMCDFLPARPQTQHISIRKHVQYNQTAPSIRIVYTKQPISNLNLNCTSIKIHKQVPQQPACRRITPHIPRPPIIIPHVPQSNPLLLREIRIPSLSLSAPVQHSITRLDHDWTFHFSFAFGHVVSVRCSDVYTSHTYSMYTRPFLFAPAWMMEQMG